MSEDRWSIAEGEDRGKALIFRIRNQPPSFARKHEYPHLVAISWYFDSPSETGMPADDVFQRMAQLENLLKSALEQRRQAFVTVVVTGNGVREWQWYSRDPSETMRLVNEELADYDPFPIQFTIQEDPGWDAYLRFQEICLSGDREPGEG